MTRLHDRRVIVWGTMVAIDEHVGSRTVSAGSPSPRSILRVYVDETGDRGVSGSSSPFFAFAAVLVADEDEPPTRAAVSKLRRDLRVPQGKQLHWKDHVKTFSRRQHVTKTLTVVPGLMVVYVLVEKSAIPAAAAMRQDHAIFYNFAAGLILERVLLAAKYWPGGARRVVLRFGHVRGFDHQRTRGLLRSPRRAERAGLGSMAPAQRPGTLR